MIVTVGGKMVVSRGGNTLLQAERKGSLYYLKASVEKGQDELHSVTEDDFRLWHTRLGHPAAGSIQELAKLGVIKGVETRD